VGLEDRDWYREKPSEAWRKLFPKHGPPRRGAESPILGRTAGSHEPSGGMQAQRYGRRRGKSFVKGWLVPLALAAAIGVGVAAWQDHDLPWQTEENLATAIPDVAKVSPSHPKARPSTKPAARSHARIDSPKVIHFRSRPGLDTPARRVTRWFVTDPRFGRVSVYVPVGTTPREALTRALAAKGYQVLP
jgi:hypothetical protein